MPKLTRIYTRTGDDGATRLGTNTEVPKDAIRVQAYGEVDELNSSIGVALASGLNPRLKKVLTNIQNELFVLGADLAFPREPEDQSNIPTIGERHVTILEELIDEMVSEVGPLENFILPGGTVGAAYLHYSRTICRRAERSLVRLAREEPVNKITLKYLNRLSDALFVMARFENWDKGNEESLWDSHI